MVKRSRRGGDRDRGAAGTLLEEPKGFRYLFRGAGGAEIRVGELIFAFLQRAGEPVQFGRLVEPPVLPPLRREQVVPGGGRRAVPHRAAQESDRVPLPVREREDRLRQRLGDHRLGVQPRPFGFEQRLPLRHPVQIAEDVGLRQHPRRFVRVLRQKRIVHRQHPHRVCVEAGEGQRGERRQRVVREPVAHDAKCGIGRAAVVVEQRLLHRVEALTVRPIGERREVVEQCGVGGGDEREAPRAERREPLDERPDRRVHGPAVEAVDDGDGASDRIRADAQPRLREPGFHEREDERCAARNEFNGRVQFQRELARDPAAGFGAMALGRVGQSIGGRSVVAMPR